MNRNNVIRFDDGTKLKRCTECTYLRHHITQSYHPVIQCSTESGSKNATIYEHLVQTQSFLESCACTTRWKLRVYHAIIQNKLIYELETLHLTQAMLEKIDAFHLHGLQSILGLETTFVNHMNTNEFVRRTDSEHSGREIQLFSELLKKQVALAGHILRTDDSDPFDRPPMNPVQHMWFSMGKRRVGGPRQQWRHFRHKYIWDNLSDERTEYENTNRKRQNQRIHQQALARTFECSRNAGPQTLECPWPPKTLMLHYDLARSCSRSRSLSLFIYIIIYIIYIYTYACISKIFYTDTHTHSHVSLYQKPESLELQPANGPIPSNLRCFFLGAAKVSTGAIVEEVARVGERLCYRHFLSACPVSNSCLFLILFGYCNSVWNQFNPIQFNSNF